MYESNPNTSAVFRSMDFFQNLYPESSRILLRALRSKTPSGKRPVWLEPPVRVTIHSAAQTATENPGRDGRGAPLWEGCRGKRGGNEMRPTPSLDARMVNRKPEKKMNSGDLQKLVSQIH